MTAPSYATATAVTPERLPSNNRHVARAANEDLSQRRTCPPSIIMSQIKELSEPPPQSFSLVATISLLEPLEETQPDVYLMTRSYLQNWVIWAFHQKVNKIETARLEEAVTLAAKRLGLVVPRVGMAYHDPGPIDASILAMEGHPLLLRPNVVAVNDPLSESSFNVPAALRRTKSLPDESEKKSEIGDSSRPPDFYSSSSFSSPSDLKGDQILCCAVPCEFYEILRAVQGVLCDDGFTISFQPAVDGNEHLLQHHSHTTTKDVNNKNNKSLSGSHHNPPNSSSSTSRRRLHPIEFRRRVLMKPEPKFLPSPDLIENASPMTKLLMEQERQRQPRMIPWIEIYPVKLHYTVVETEKIRVDSPMGLGLVSRRSRVYDSLQDLMKAAAPRTISSCRRLWVKRANPGTKNAGDGFELVDLQGLDGNLLRKDDTGSTPQLTVDEWIMSYGDGPTCGVKELDILVEIRRAASERWPREAMELGNRLGVGDFVDAQDSAGKWYEAIVREIDEDSVTVHYFGWASKWDCKLRRRLDSETDGKAGRMQSPAPLWTHSHRWRQITTEGKLVEVRDTSSRVDRPKWYKGVVRKVGSHDGKPEIIVGGATLELYDDLSGRQDQDGNIVKKPLLLLNRTDQILVEVDEEKPSHTAMVVTPAATEPISVPIDLLKPEPPFLRWVNLYGEEICQAGTHMKIESDGGVGVVTLRYEYDANRKPVEVMKSWNNMYGQGFMKESLVGTPPAPGSVGMHNLGNSCFLNSIIQCLNHIEPLTQYFLKGDYVHNLNRKNPLGSGGRVATAYASLLKEIWCNKYSALAPRMLKQTVASFAPQFNNSFQHDSQEFCQFLMDGLHEDCNRVKSKPYMEEVECFGMKDEKAAVETWRRHLLRHDSIIVDHFQGMHRSHLTCTSCGHESVKFDVYSTISVPLAEDKNGLSAIMLEDCIEKFLEGEQLDEMNAWYCPSCKKHVCALKMIALWSVPDVLIVHLKRFQFDHCKVRNDIVRSKIDATVKFPIDTLDLRRHILGPVDESAPPVFKLFGVSEHMGFTANSGHYTATVRNSKDGRWYRYNDAHVGETSGDAAITGGAYVLFYQRINGTSRWGGMEKFMLDKGIDPYGALETDQDGFTKVSSGKKNKKP